MLKMCLTTSSSLNPNAKPWISLTQLNHMVVIKLPHQLFPPPPPPPPHLVVGFPPPFYYHPTTTILHHHPMKINHFHYPSLLSTDPNQGCGGDGGERNGKRVVIEEIQSVEMKGSEDGEKMVLSRRVKRVNDGFRKKNGIIKQFWRPINAKSDEKFAVNVAENDDYFDKNTTVMIKNIPNKYRRNALMGFLDDCCRNHHLEYDFLYLPMDFRTLDNLGYAFVNFTTPAAAMKCKNILQNYKWGRVYGPDGWSTSKKVCEITWARIQGKDALVRHFEKSKFTCKTRKFLPVVFQPPRNGSSNSTKEQIIGELWTQGANRCVS